MTSKRRISLQLILKTSALFASLGFIVMYVIVALKRLPYPFELEWMEGSMVDHVRRVLNGLPLYVSPSLDFVPFLYPPLFFWTAAAVAQLTGIGFEPLRLVSLAASLGAMLLMFLLVRRESGSWKFGLLAAGVFAATYRNVGGWFDVGRVDSLFLMLVLTAVCLIRCRETLPSWIIAGLALAAAVLTKQVALAPAAALIAYGWCTNRRLATALSASFILVITSSVVWMSSATDGWFWYYVFAQPAAHKIVISTSFYFICRGICFGLGIAVLMVVTGLVLLRRNGDTKGFTFWLLFIVGMFAASALPLMKAGGWQNNTIPAYAALSLSLAVFVPKLIMHAEFSFEQLRLSVFIWMAVLIQLAGLLYDPSARIPTIADEQAGHDFINQLSTYPGEVLVFGHGSIPLLAGKKPHANSIAVTDVLSAGSVRTSEKLLSEFQQALREKRFSAIILDAPDDLSFAAADFVSNYCLERGVFDFQKVFWPVSGFPTRPQFIYLPRSE